MITVTVAAIDKVLSLIEKEEEQGLALRLAITGRGPGGFQYNLAFVKEDDRQPDDLLEDVGPFKIIIDPQSAPHLEGATVDFMTQGVQSGFQINNPNPLWDDPKAQTVQELIDRNINPSIASHGGHVALVEVKDDVVYLAFGGGCQGCGMIDVTLKQGVEVMIKEAVPEIKGVVDITDHASGENPYHTSKDGSDAAVK